MKILKYFASIIVLNVASIHYVQANELIVAAKNGNLAFLQKYIKEEGDINEAVLMDGVKDTHNQYHNRYFSDNPRYLRYFDYAWKNLGEGYNFSMTIAIEEKSKFREPEYNLTQTPLVTAIIHNQEVAAKLLINAGADVAVLDNKDRLPIHYACYYGRTNLIEPLIQANIKSNDESNINLNEETKLKRSPLLMSFYGGSVQNLATIKLLIKLGADVNDTDALGRTPLILAAQDNNMELVKALVEKGVDVNATDENKNFPLAYAVLHNNLEMIKYLVSKGAETSKLFRDSNLLALAALGPDYLKKPLMPGTVATTNSSIPTMAYLIDKKIDPNGGDTPPLHMAILSNNIANVKYLISKGASVSKLVGSGNERSPMHQAAFKNRIEIAKILIGHQAKINTLDDDDYTPSDYAVRYGFDELFALLKRHGGKVKPPPPAPESEDEY